jgi:hypothetical protein
MLFAYLCPSLQSTYFTTGTTLGHALEVFLTAFLPLVRDLQARARMRSQPVKSAHEKSRLQSFAAGGYVLLASGENDS